MHDLIQYIQRNKTLDKPALLFYELIGNDVCAVSSVLYIYK